MSASDLVINLCTSFLFYSVVHCNTTNADINCTSDTTTTGMFDEGGCAFCCNAEQGVTTNGRCLLDHGWTIGDPLCITGKIFCVF